MPLLALSCCSCACEGAAFLWVKCCQRQQYGWATGSHWLYSMPLCSVEWLCLPVTVLPSSDPVSLSFSLLSTSLSTSRCLLVSSSQPLLVRLYLAYPNLQTAFHSHLSPWHLDVNHRPEALLFLLLRPHVSIPGFVWNDSPTLCCHDVLRITCCPVEAFYPNRRTHSSFSQSSASSLMGDGEENGGLGFL